MKRELLVALVLISLVVAIQPAQAAVTATVTVTPSSGALVGQTIALSWTKTIGNVADGLQAGTVRIEISGPASFTTGNLSYNFVTLAAPESRTLNWTWAPTAAGTYTLYFNDNATQGLERDINVTNYSVTVPPVQPPFVPKWSGAQKLYDSNGTEVTGRSWGNWTPIANAQNVPGTTWLRFRNDAASVLTVYVQFQDTHFRAGANTIDLNGNIVFRYGYDSSKPPASPTQSPLVVDGAFVQVVPAGETLWVTYNVRDMPSTVAASQYLAPFTVITNP